MRTDVLGVALGMVGVVVGALLESLRGGQGQYRGRVKFPRDGV